MNNVLANTQATLAVVFSGGYADGPVTVTVTDAAGRQVATGAATLDNTTAGRYTYTLAAQAQVASLTIAWAGTWGGAAEQIDTVAEIVGTHLFTLAELRGFDDGKLSDADEFPDDLLAVERDTVTDCFEQVCNVSFVRRYQRDQLEGNRRQHLYLMRRRPRKLLAVTADGQAWDQDDLDAVTMFESGKLYRSTWWPWNAVTPRNIVVEYEHGFDRVPAPIKRAALILARYELVAADVSDRTLSLSTELGQVRLSVPGPNYPTGIPTVDRALFDYDETGDLEAF